MIPTSPPAGGLTEPAGGDAGDGRNRRRRATSWASTAAALLAAYLVALLAVNLSGADSVAGRIVDTLFPRIGSGRLDVRSLNAAWDVVQREYVVKQVDSGVATAGTERGLIAALQSRYGDRFSAYFTADQFTALQRDLAGKRTGSVGIALEARCQNASLCPAGATPSVVAIEDVLRDQPADRAGLRDNDILVSVDGHDVSTLPGDASARIDILATPPGGATGAQPDCSHFGVCIRGAAGTTVTLGVQRGAQRLEVPVARADLSIPSVYAQRFGPTLYVQVTGFDEHTGDDCSRALRDGLASGATSVILDLRHNPGGLVEEAQKTASQFLTRKAGTEEDVVVRRGRIADGAAASTADKVERDPILDGGVAQSVPLVVLVDGDSASAAEIVAAAMHDYHRGVLVGARTFGKGSVQEDFQLPDGSDLHLTVEKWFGPAGETIDGKGIDADVAVSLPDDDHRFRLDAQSPDAGADAQLQAALHRLQPG